MDNITFTEQGNAVTILDQSRLPGEERLLTLRTKEEMRGAIHSLKVRGAPAIGIFAAWCLAALAQGMDKDTAEFIKELEKIAAYLGAARPTAVNLNWALNRMVAVAQNNRELESDRLKSLLTKESIAIRDEDMAMCQAISSYGLSLLRDGDTVLTHCNAGPLATSKYGTALGPILLGTEKGFKFKVFADETRPLLQGARLTAYELEQAGVDVTLICDNMAATVMKKGWISACLVGCDRVAANGDVANKIGTSGVAILAKYYGIPFYVLGPTSSIDMNCFNGDRIEIELRDPDEIKAKFYEKPMAPAGVKCYNPAFDITDRSLITAIVTQKGICRPPFTESIAALFKQE